jgi:hypothetical protein
MDSVVGVQRHEIPPELVTQLAETVIKTACRYEMLGRPEEAVRMLESALRSGEQQLGPEDRALLLGHLARSRYRMAVRGARRSGIEVSAQRARCWDASGRCPAPINVEGAVQCMMK